MGFMVGCDISRMPAGQLTIRKIDSLCDGVHGDGGNLYLTIKGQARHWTVRYFSPTTNKRREIGIGSAYILTLTKAKKQKHIPNFAELAERYIEEQQTGWKDPRSAPIWRSSLSRIAYPVIGSKIVSSIDTDDILAVLKPIWTTKTETADRVRGRIERILDYATTHYWREGDNPARWKGHIQYPS